MDGSSPASVRDVMVAVPIVAAPEESVRDAVRRMNRHRIGALPIVSEGRVVGIFSERDALQRVPRAQSGWIDETVGAHMTRGLVTAAPDEPWRAVMPRMAEHGIRHLPIVEDGRLVGMLSIRDLLRRQTEELEAEVAQRTRELRRQMGAIEARDRERSHHLALAGEVQARLLPERLPDLPPLRLFAHHAPRDGVSGDHYDALQLDDDTWGWIVADVSGHGLPAALVTVMAKSVYETRCAGLRSPAEVLRCLDQHLRGLLDEQFLTVCAAMVDRRDLRLVWASGGHPPPLLHRPRQRRVERLEGAGPMLGVLDAPVFEEREVVLEAGDRVLFYTDGVTEHRDAERALFGTEGLIAALTATEEGAPGERVLEQLLAALAAHGRGRPFDDDVTLLLLEVRPS